MVAIPKPESQTVGAIYAAYAAARQSWDSAGLSISSLGTECDRALWYEFRWAAEQTSHTGQRLRLFETGNREETRMLADLRSIGCEVSECDPKTGRQWKVFAAGGHLRGKLDGAALGVPEAPKTWHVVEAKTHNAKNFRDLVKNGVEKSKPGHFAQCQLYMHLTGMTRALYLAHCKDDDALYAERLYHDAAWCARQVARVERIVRAASPPARLHEDPDSKAAFACGWCPAQEACHRGAFARRNCRTCLHSTPVSTPGDERGGWNCARHGKPLSYEEQRAGCPQHRYIPGVVPGEQFDCDEAAETVTYKRPDGSTWVDGADRKCAGEQADKHGGTHADAA